MDNIIKLPRHGGAPVCLCVLACVLSLKEVEKVSGSDAFWMQEVLMQINSSITLFSFEKIERSKQQAACKPAGSRAGKDLEQLTASEVDSSVRQSDQANHRQPTHHYVVLRKQEVECVR